MHLNPEKQVPERGCTGVGLQEPIEVQAIGRQWARHALPGKETHDGQFYLILPSSCISRGHGCMSAKPSIKP